MRHESPGHLDASIFFFVCDSAGLHKYYAAMNHLHTDH